MGSRLRPFQERLQREFSKGENHCPRPADSQPANVVRIDGMNEALAGVLGGLALWLRTRGATCAEVACFGPTDLVEALRQAGFVYRKSEAPERVVMTSAVVGAGDGKQTCDSPGWYFMTADTSSN